MYSEYYYIEYVQVLIGLEAKYKLNNIWNFHVLVSLTVYF